MERIKFRLDIYKTILGALNFYDDLPKSKTKALSQDRVLNFVASWIQFHQGNESEPEVTLSDLIWIGHNKIKKLFNSAPQRRPVSIKECTMNIIL